MSRDRAVIVRGLVVVLAASGAAGLLLSPGAGWLFAACSLPIWCAVAVALGKARARDPSSPLVVATQLTLLRGLLVSLVAGFLLLRQEQRGLVAWLPGLLYLTAVLTDRYDGIVARRAGQVTELGARLDVAMDGLGLLVAPLVAVVWNRLPPWYLLVGAAYYVFHGGIAFRRRLGAPVYPERLRPSRVTRFFAGVQMGLVAVALLPILDRILDGMVNTVAATLLMLPTLVLFARDWLVVVGRLGYAVTIPAPWPSPEVRGSVEPGATEESLAR